MDYKKKVLNIQALIDIDVGEHHLKFIMLKQ